MPYSPFRTGNALIDRNLDAISAAVNPPLVPQPPAWIPAALTGGFASLTGTSVGYALINGIVYGRGIVQNKSGAITGNSPGVYVLPVGMRPGIGKTMIGRYYDGSDGFKAYDIEATGTVRPIVAFAVDAWIALEFCFPAEA